MALADTAKLVAILELQDKFTKPAAAANASLTALEDKTTLASRGFAGISRVAAGAGGALSTFKSRLGGIVSGPLGLLGLGAAAFSVGHLIGESIGQAKDFGAEVLRLNALTGLGTQKTSELAAAFEHFGIAAEDSQRVAGFAEKNLFKLGGTATKAKKFFDTYGLSLTDSTGKLKDFNTILLDSADFFNNKSIPAQQKAAALAAIYGKSWQTLIPVLSAGRDTIADVEQEAAKLGLTLTDQNLGDLVKLRDATRDWSTALGGLKLQIGLALVPALTGLTTAATDFLKNGGREKIVGFFKDAVAFGQQAGDTIQRDVIPIFKGIYGAWQSVPAELRDLIIKGFAVDRTIKFLFGFSPASLVISGLKELIGSKFIPQLVTVTNPGFGFPGGAAPVAGEIGAGEVGAGLLGGATLGTLAAAAAAGAVAILGTAAILKLAGAKYPTDSQGRIITGTGPTNPSGFGPKGQIRTPLPVEDTKTHEALKGFKGQLPGAPGGGHPAAAQVKLNDAQLIAALAKTSEFGYKGIGTAIEHGLLTGTDPYGKQALALFQRAEFPRQGKTLGEIQRHITAAEDAMQQFLAHGDVHAAEQLQATISGLRALLTGTDKVYTITQAEAEKRAATANRLNRLLDPLPGGIAALNAKDFSPTVNVTVPITNLVQLSTSNTVRRINSYVAAVGSGPGGALSAINL